jgi:hypothetical protein
MQRTLLVAAALLTISAAGAAAQDTTAARRDTAAAPANPAAQAAPQAYGVRPGMTEAQVVAQWGEPLAKRTVGAWTYLFYPNGVEQEVRFLDVVFLQNGQVVDAIVRAAEHVYLGQSSSPPGRIPEPTLPRPAGQEEANPGSAAVTGVRINP